MERKTDLKKCREQVIEQAKSLGKSSINLIQQELRAGLNVAKKAINDIVDGKKSS